VKAKEWSKRKSARLSGKSLQRDRADLSVQSVSSFESHTGEKGCKNIFSSSDSTTTDYGGIYIPPVS